MLVIMRVVFVLNSLVLLVRASPFALSDKYIEDFQNGLEELKKLSKEYEYHEENFDHTVYNETQALRDAEEYDFIIVGGGASGAVIANRLSEVPEWKVLLLEAGGPETRITQVPSMYHYLQTTPYNWNFATTPQKTACLGMEEHRCSIEKGKALGGTTSTNNMIFTRGNVKDYDTWADLGNDGWCYKDVLPYFKKLEDVHIENIDRKHHNLGGPLHLQHAEHSQAHLAPHFIEAGHELGLKEVDYNGKQQLGIGIPQLAIKEGKRQSTAEAYLEPAHKRKNLIIKPLSHVIKISISQHTKEAYGVKYLHDGSLFIAKANKEVILAAGPINTPKLLKLSGVGPKEELEALDIHHVNDLKVGHNLKDHIAFIGLNFIFNESKPVEHDLHDEIVSYLRTGKGPFATTDLEALAFIKTEDSKDKTNFPEVELIFTTDIRNKGYEHLKNLRIKKEIYEAVWQPLEGKQGFSVDVVLPHPKSSGTVLLHDKDPLHHPLIDLNPFSDVDEHDVETLVAGIKSALKLYHTEALQKLGIILNKHPVLGCEQIDFGSDDYWKCAIKHLTISLGDVSGTARMGPETDKDAVVDHTLKVYGVHKLRVADASVIPVTITGQLMAPTVMIGEKASELIKKDWH